MILRRTCASVVVLLALSSCTTDAGGDGSAGPARSTNVDVDTPELRTAKAAAGVEPCEPGPADTIVEDGLPDVVLPCLGGGPDVDLSSLRGPMVINLFASWCGPCREELPYYQQLHERAGDKVDVLGIDYLDVQPAKALAMVDEAGVTYPLLADPDSLLRAPLRATALPGVLFVDADGKLTHIEYVEIESFGQLRDMVDRHLDVTV